ncbi:rRNA maturation RNase YbeY [uncultured Eudoraea sp.]|uniref:rRNA maturation RNase YbeY n=1 Tax=uncultured Eudoraea sp. TaxID=1035614 RepID=UPI00263772A4|nr:rRNA maturation RNase YbeY [uncultured Eudoraea sp.]
MISFFYNIDFKLEDESKYTEWIINIFKSEKQKPEDLSYVFCSDDFLHRINQDYLNHNTYTDIITFDYSEGKGIKGEIYISIDRIKDNAKTYGVEFSQELRRVMAHGILHLLGYSDKTAREKEFMRGLENEKMNLFHVKHC